MGLTPSEELCLYACFIRALRKVAFDALEQYRREYDDDKKAFRASAVHDWTSHPADAFRYLAMGYRPAPRKVVKEPKRTGWIIPPPRDVERGGIVL